MSRWKLFGLMIVMAVGLTSIAVTPPAVQGAQTGPYGFSAERAMTDVRALSQTPRLSGSKSNAAMRLYLEQRLSSLGLDVLQSEFSLEGQGLDRLNRWTGETKTTQSLFNIVAIAPGQNRDLPAVLLMAHHDTVPDSPGAADDAFGLAAILEIVRAIQSSGGQERDLIVLLTDGEELALSGAMHFFTQNSLRERVGAVINFEARGGGGTSDLFQTSSGNGAAVRLYAKSVSQPGASSLSTFVYSILPNDTDLTPALKTGVTAYNIANIGAAQFYHSPKATADAVDPKTLQHMGGQGLDLTRALLKSSVLPRRTTDATFFDAFGLFTVIYAPFWGWIFMALSVIFYAVSLRPIGFRSSELKIRQMDVSVRRKATPILYGLGAMLSVLILGGGGLFALNKLSGSGAGSNYYDRLAAIPRLELLAVAACLAVLLIFLKTAPQDTARSEKMPLDTRGFEAKSRFGAAIPFLILGIVLQAFAPTASYWITLPILFCAASSFIWTLHDPRVWAQILTVFLAALVVGFVLRLAHLLILGIGADFLWIAVLPAGLIGLAALPLWPRLSKRISRIGAGVLLMGALILALWIRYDGLAATVPLYG